MAKVTHCEDTLLFFDRLKMHLKESNRFISMVFLLLQRRQVRNGSVSDDILISSLYFSITGLGTLGNFNAVSTLQTKVLEAPGKPTGTKIHLPSREQLLCQQANHADLPNLNGHCAQKENANIENSLLKALTAEVEVRPWIWQAVAKASGKATQV